MKEEKSKYIYIYFLFCEENFGVLISVCMRVCLYIYVFLHVCVNASGYA